MIDMFDEQVINYERIYDTTETQIKAFNPEKYYCLHEERFITHYKEISNISWIGT